VRIDGGDAELLVATLRRPRGRRAQVAILGIDHAESGGALAECVLTPPLSAAEARGFLTGEASLEGAPPGHPIAAPELAARSVAAARSAVEADVALDHEAAIALPLLARAFTGDPAGLARPRVTLPWPDDDPELIVDAAEDEDGFEAVMALLLDELEEFRDRELRARRRGVAPRRLRRFDDAAVEGGLCCASWMIEAASRVSRWRSWSKPAPHSARSSTSVPAARRAGDWRNRWRCRCSRKASIPPSGGRWRHGYRTSTPAPRPTVTPW